MSLRARGLLKRMSLAKCDEVCATPAGESEILSAGAALGGGAAGSAGALWALAVGHPPP